MSGFGGVRSNGQEVRNMTKKMYKVTWTTGDGIKYTENFTSDALLIEQIPSIFERQTTRRSGFKVVHVEEIG